MRFTYDERKTAQAAAYLLSKGGGRMEYLKLLKLLYLADRKSFVDTGAPISGDRWVSMKRGPVLSQTYDEIRRGDDDLPSAWREYISPPTNYRVSVSAGDRDELSQQDIEILDEIHNLFGHWTSNQLIKYVHDLPEWHDPGNSSRPIDPIEILLASGYAAEEIRLIGKDLDEVARMDDFRRWGV